MTTDEPRQSNAEGESETPRKTESADHHEIEPVAAERYDGPEPCAYEDCVNPAVFRVELRRGQQATTTLMCDKCSKTNRIWVEENDLLDHEITDEARGASA